LSNNAQQANASQATSQAHTTDELDTPQQPIGDLPYLLVYGTDTALLILESPVARNRIGESAAAALETLARMSRAVPSNNQDNWYGFTPDQLVQAGAELEYSQDALKSGIDRLAQGSPAAVARFKQDGVTGLWPQNALFERLVAE
jgi:hypothetical protein